MNNGPPVKRSGTLTVRRKAGAPSPMPAPSATATALAPEVAPSTLQQVAVETPTSVAIQAREVPRRKRLMALGGGIVALLLAGAGEALVEAKNGTIFGLVLYLAAIAIFVYSARLLPSLPEDLPGPVQPGRPAAGGRKRVWAITAGGVGLSLAFIVLALQQLKDNLSSGLGIVFWILSMAALAVLGVVLVRGQGWSPRWAGGVLPRDRRGRFIVFGLLALILVVAAASRLIALDRVPFGINADEGDRGAISIAIVHGDNNQSIFDNGWYWISVLYFWLLAQVMKVFGVGWVGARVLGALAGIISVGTVTALGIRHFNLRTGLFAGGILSMLAVSLQFSRETSEAGPTATLWAISIACFLEAARRGRTWAWICAGLAGGFSLYFYPSGRLWVLVAAVFCVYLFVHGLGGKRWGIVRGAALAAFASIVVMAPFIQHGLAQPNQEVIFQRARETSIFTGQNAARLHYYKPEWSTTQLLAEQTVRSVGVLNQFADDGGFWPTDKPVMSGLLVVLTMLGLGWCCTRWRDPRFVMLGLWFWIGLLGVIITVETPNVQRMATTVPVLALLPALALDNLLKRFESFFAGDIPRFNVSVRWVARVAGAALLLFMMFVQYQYYFVTYAAMDRWPQPTALGAAVGEQGKDALVVTLGRQFHMVNSGWVRLMAPNTARGGIETPGNYLPLALPAQSDLTFLYFPKQSEYLPYISSLYPSGVTKPYTHTTEGLMFTTYRVTRQQWEQTQGAMVESKGVGKPVRVPHIGTPPSGQTTYPAQMRWKAGLRVPRYWNYTFKVGPGPAHLLIDGNEVVSVAAGEGDKMATVLLPRGEHFVDFEGTVLAAGKDATFVWGTAGPANPPLARPETFELYAGMDAPHGLLSVVQRSNTNTPEDRGLDGTLASCCLNEHFAAIGQSFTSTWTGSLDAPVTGVYSMTLFAQGTISMRIDGKTVFNAPRSDEPHEASVELARGLHPVEVSFNVVDAPGGLEWKWTPPGGKASIVPPSALVPPEGETVKPPVALEVLVSRDAHPSDTPLSIVK